MYDCSYTEDKADASGTGRTGRVVPSRHVVCFVAFCCVVEVQTGHAGRCERPLSLLQVLLQVLVGYILILSITSSRPSHLSLHEARDVFQELV